MNGPGDIPTANGTTAEEPCGITSLLPSFGMSCRGRAEAFARRLQSRLRTLGSQTGDSPTNDDDPILHSTENTWLSQDGHQTVVTSLQPLRHMSQEADSFFDFDCEPESPGSPADECEYSRLIETASTTPQNDCAPESGYICASPVSPENGSQGSQSSSDGPYFDPESSEAEQRSLTNDYHDCLDSKHETSHNTMVNGHHNTSPTSPVSPTSQCLPNDSSESLSESLPPSQESTSTNATTPGTQSSLTFTGAKSASNNTLQDVVLSELQQQSDEVTKLQNGHCEDYVEEEDRIATNGCLENPDDNQVEEDQVEEDQVEEDHEVKVPSPIVTSPTPEPVLDTENDHEKKQTAAEQEKEDDRKHLSACDTDDDDERPQRVRRCSSLKTGKTPPGTPGRKKIVRFADVLGLDLADVKTFLDEIPTIPKSAYEDLEVVESEPPVSLGPRAEKMLMPLFQQPAGLANFLDIVREKQVSLENAAVTDAINLTVTGSVRVRNLDFNKSVHIRYSLDNWRSFADLQANYAENSCDGFSDKFSFILFGNSMHVGQRMEFAVRFQCKGQQFWDNNYGANYCFQCLPVTTPNSRPHIPHHHASSILSPSDTWTASFY